MAKAGQQESWNKENEYTDNQTASSNSLFDFGINGNSNNTINTNSNLPFSASQNQIIKSTYSNEDSCCVQTALIPFVNSITYIYEYQFLQNYIIHQNNLIYLHNISQIHSSQASNQYQNIKLQLPFQKYTLYKEM